MNGNDNLAQAIKRLKKQPHTPPPPQGLPGELYDRLETALLTCAPADCHPLFIDQRLIAWSDHIPKRTCDIEQVRSIIATLFPRHSDTGENALVLFLIVLSEHTNPADSCQRHLYRLSTELRNLLKHQNE